MMYDIKCTGCDDICPDWSGFTSRREAEAEASLWQKWQELGHTLVVVERV